MPLPQVLMNASALDVASQNQALVGTVVSLMVPPPSTPQGVMEQAVAKGGSDPVVVAALEAQYVPSVAFRLGLS
jgi:hypothetical protein